MKRLIVFLGFLTLPNLGFGQMQIIKDLEWEYIPLAIEDWKEYNGESLFHIRKEDINDRALSYYNISMLDHKGSVKRIVCKQMKEQYSFGEPTLYVHRGWEYEYNSNSKLTNAERYKRVICNITPRTEEKIVFNNDRDSRDRSQTRFEYIWEGDGSKIKVNVYYKGDSNKHEELCYVLQYEYVDRKLKTLNRYDNKGVKCESFYFTYAGGRLSEMKFYINNNSKPEIIKQYKYDSRGNVTYYSYYKDNIIAGYLTEVWFDNIYDSKGNIVAANISSKNSYGGKVGSINSWHRTYEYDNHNNWIKIVEEGDSNLILVRDIEY